jgi:hypothetical protein
LDEKPIVLMSNLSLQFSSLEKKNIEKRPKIPLSNEIYFIIPQIQPDFNKPTLTKQNSQPVRGSSGRPSSMHVDDYMKRMTKPEKEVSQTNPLPQLISPVGGLDLSPSQQLPKVSIL